MDDQRRDKDHEQAVPQQQHTGNHPSDKDAGGADRFGGTRAGAGNVERVLSGRSRPTDPERIEARHERAR